MPGPNLLTARAVATIRGNHNPVRTFQCTHLAVLRDLDLLDELAERGTIPGAVLAADTDFLGALAHGG